jgi:hypothetical protein
MPTEDAKSAEVKMLTPEAAEGFKDFLQSIGVFDESNAELVRPLLEVVQGAIEGLTPQVRQALKELPPELHPIVVTVLEDMRRNIASVVYALQNPELNN